MTLWAASVKNMPVTTLVPLRLKNPEGHAGDIGFSSGFSVSTTVDWFKPEP